MLMRLVIAGLTGYFYGRGGADSRQRVNLFASFALQEAAGSRTIASIRTAKADEIPAWLDPLLQRHIADEARHAYIFRRAVEAESVIIDEESSGAVRAMESVGDGSFKRFHKAEDLAEVPLTQLLAGILIAEESGVRSFRALLKSLPTSMVETRTGLQSVLEDEERHVRYLTDALRALGGSNAAAAMRQKIESHVLNDFTKILEHLTSKKERPVLVKPTPARSTEALTLT